MNTLNTTYNYINTFSNIKTPNVRNKIDIYTFIDSISNCNDDQILLNIEKARYYHQKGNKTRYDEIKEQIPCFTLNFEFDKYKKNDNIIGSTGFIYIDVDKNTNIDLSNEMIFASWRSLSNTGRGILVKADGINPINFRYNYMSVSEKLGLKTDKHANKASQYTIHSYDPELYINEDSIIYNAVEEIEKLPTSLLLKEEKKVNTEMGKKREVRYNNTSDYDFKNKPYIYFPDNKEKIAEVFVPWLISEGSRNSILFFYGLQLRKLNPWVTPKVIENHLDSINIKRCVPPLDIMEIKKIRNNIMKSDISKLDYNKERRIIFNPEFELSRKEKLTIVNQKTGDQKRKKTYNELKELVLRWDFHKYGKITGIKLKAVSGKNKKTVYKYLKELKNDPDICQQFEKK